MIGRGLLGIVAACLPASAMMPPAVYEDSLGNVRHEVELTVRSVTRLPGPRMQCRVTGRVVRASVNPRSGHPRTLTPPLPARGTRYTAIVPCFSIARGEAPPIGGLVLSSEEQLRSAVRIRLLNARNGGEVAGHGTGIEVIGGTGP